MKHSKFLKQTVERKEAPVNPSVDPKMIEDTLFDNARYDMSVSDWQKLVRQSIKDSFDDLDKTIDEIANEVLQKKQETRFQKLKRYFGFN